MGSNVFPVQQEVNSVSTANFNGYILIFSAFDFLKEKYTLAWIQLHFMLFFVVEILNLFPIRCVNISLIFFFYISENSFTVFCIKISKPEVKRCIQVDPFNSCRWIQLNYFLFVIYTNHDFFADFIFRKSNFRSNFFLISLKIPRVAGQAFVTTIIIQAGMTKFRNCIPRRKVVCMDNF